MGLLLLCVPPLLSSACGDNTPRPSFVTDRDSAGVQIIENGDGAIASAELWSLSREPLLEVGALGGVPEYELFRVRGGLILDQGMVAIVNGGSREVRFYDLAGRYLGAQGRRGEGPGEYMGLQAIWRFPGDSILAWDRSLRRASMIGPSREFARTLNFQGDFTNYRLEGVSEDGSVLVVYGRPSEEETAGEWQQLHSTYTLFSPTGEPLDSLGWFPTYRMKFLSGSSSFGEGVGLGFDRETQGAVAGRRALIGTTRGYEVLEFNSDATLSRIIRWSGPAREVTPTHLDQYLQDQLAQIEDEQVRRSIRIDHETREFAEQFPAYSRILVDERERLWVEEYRRPGADGDNEWLIFDESGSLRATLQVPVDLRLLDVRRNQVLAVFTDELGVEYVRLYAVEMG